ncbi:hypothetical protein [Aquimarina litoralis]|uniref:hypothetical protein n=1 Tax=Aquimarina litoralis TaxID=584605 RepID=UPI001C56DFD1|nr:hypothetical protein [Aquimarina litoralis]MBW1294044.1 hypothetical protein [Aquimarina litoralis]
MNSSDWSYDSLYKKAQLYVQRALKSERNSGLFPFWASLSLELLGRATLSKIHPVLISDPREGGNILHAFGFSPKKSTPKTIGAKTIFIRLQIMLDKFTEQNEKFSQSFINMRNEELHTGTPIFETLSTNVWLTDYYKTIKVLLEHHELTLEDFLGKEEAEVAIEMIESFNEKLKTEILGRISKYSDVFESLDPDEKKEKEDALGKKNQAFIFKEKLFNKYKEVECPSCKNKAILIGKFISQSEPKVKDDKIQVHHNLLPIGLKCFCCSLKLNNSSEISQTNFGGQFSIEESIEPLEYYEIEIDPIEELQKDGYTLDDLADHFEPDFDYGND